MNNISGHTNENESENGHGDLSEPLIGVLDLTRNGLMNMSPPSVSSAGATKVQRKTTSTSRWQATGVVCWRFLQKVPEGGTGQLSSEQSFTVTVLPVGYGQVGKGIQEMAMLLARSFLLSTPSSQRMTV